MRTQWNPDGSHSNAYWANKSSKAIKENRCLPPQHDDVVSTCNLAQTAFEHTWLASPPLMLTTSSRWQLMSFFGGSG